MEEGTWVRSLELVNAGVAGGVGRAAGGWITRVVFAPQARTVSAATALERRVPTVAVSVSLTASPSLPIPCCGMLPANASSRNVQKRGLHYLHMGIQSQKLPAGNKIWEDVILYDSWSVRQSTTDNQMLEKNLCFEATRKIQKFEIIESFSNQNTSYSVIHNSVFENDFLGDAN